MFGTNMQVRLPLVNTLRGHEGGWGGGGGGAKKEKVTE